jgi:hypothetical protein
MQRLHLKGQKTSSANGLKMAQIIKAFENGAALFI